MSTKNNTLKAEKNQYHHLTYDDSVDFYLEFRFMTKN